MTAQLMNVTIEDALDILIVKLHTSYKEGTAYVMNITSSWKIFYTSCKDGEAAPDNKYHTEFERLYNTIDDRPEHLHDIIGFDLVNPETTGRYMNEGVEMLKGGNSSWTRVVFLVEDEMYQFGLPKDVCLDIILRAHAKFNTPIEEGECIIYFHE